MAPTKKLSSYSGIFSKRLPGTPVLFSLLVLMSLAVGISAVALLHYSGVRYVMDFVLLNGVLAGTIMVLLPTVLTVILIKAMQRQMSVKHIMFVSVIGAGAYSVFVLLGSALSSFLGLGFATIVVVVGDASLFALWFFVSKVVFGSKKEAVLFALVQPTLNIILLVSASRFLFSLDTPLNLLLFKLYSGIFIFMVMSYALLYTVDRPLKKNLGIGSMDVFSGMVQNWLLDVNTALTVNTKLGIKPDVDTDTVIIRNGKGQIKAIFFVPEIHYGPAGSLGASNFPYILEKHVRAKYKTSGFIMHNTVTADRNPISASQLGRLQAALAYGVRNSRPVGGGMSYSSGSSAASRVTRIAVGRLSLVTFSRAPRVTEDVSYEASELFKKQLARKHGESILIDAHNSRYESAPKGELDGVRFNSRYMKDYLAAIENMREIHKSRSQKIGVSSIELFKALGEPSDIANGNLNALVFSFNGFRYASLFFNCNNMLPSLREEILAHIKKTYNIDAEVYTTDTHAVNSVEYTVENVLGRYTKFKALRPFIDSAVAGAISNIEPVKVYHRKVVLKKFPVWGPDVGDILTDMAHSVVRRARLVSPILVLSGFVLAAVAIALV